MVCCLFIKKDLKSPSWPQELVKAEGFIAKNFFYRDTHLPWLSS